MNGRIATEYGLAGLAGLLFALAGCGTISENHDRTDGLGQARQAVTWVNGKLEPGEQCDDGNSTSGDGCDAGGNLEGTHFCWVPGGACSPKTACGDGILDSGETCDNGSIAGDGCSAACDFSNCGNGVRENGLYPSWLQEVCDDGNRYDGDGCNRLCEVEAGWACTGTPSRCRPSGVIFYNTGVGSDFRVLATGQNDPHWNYSSDDAAVPACQRMAVDWPRPLQGAQYLTNATGSEEGNNYGCVYQDFQIPSTYTADRFNLVIAAFNDNEAEADSGQSFARVNGVAATLGTSLVTLEVPSGGEAWQKNAIYSLTEKNPWVIGINRVELCNEDQISAPTGFRYSFADATDDNCGNGTVSEREECDDGNLVAGDGCSTTCDGEAGYGCTGSPSKCALTCGNGVLNPGEQCDDGNTDGADGCSAACRVESGYVCTYPGTACQPGCDDGKWVAGEECDDGNTYAADGCSATCQVLVGWECTGSVGNISTCHLLCGNSRLDAGERCDDGGRVAGDGCSVGCTIEVGYACPTPGVACAFTCGNGLLESGEQCDDGNNLSDDGCNAECALESGWLCTGTSCTFLSSCGNGIVDSREACDDTNAANGDGCTTGCQIEAGFQCSGSPSVCLATCGDSRIAGDETCDDGNLIAGDGCNVTCRTERGYSSVPSSGMGPSICTKTCGNSALDLGEECDDGGTVDGDGCTGSCLYEAGWRCLSALGPCIDVCGNGIQTPGEPCDDGNLFDGDTCTSDCKLGNGAPHFVVGESAADGGLTDDGPAPDGGSAADGNPAAGGSIDLAGAEAAGGATNEAALNLNHNDSCSCSVPGRGRASTLGVLLFSVLGFLLRLKKRFANNLAFRTMQRARLPRSSARERCEYRQCPEPWNCEQCATGTRIASKLRLAISSERQAIQ